MASARGPVLVVNLHLHQVFFKTTKVLIRTGLASNPSHHITGVIFSDCVIEQMAIQTHLYLYTSTTAPPYRTTTSIPAKLYLHTSTTVPPY